VASGRRRTARVAAALAALAGVVNLVSALLPAEADRLQVLDALVPGIVSEGATVITAAAGIGLLLLAGGLRRRQRLAWLAAVVLLCGSAVLNLTKGLDVEEALLELCLAGLLAAQAGQFNARQGPLERRAVLGPALLVVLVTGAYATLGLLANAGAVAGPLPVVRALQEAGRMAVGLGSGLGLEGRFGRSFPASVAAVFYFGSLVVAARVLAPALVRSGRDPGLARAVAASGDSLAYFALRDDRVSVRGGDSLVSWAPVGVVALAAGDPLGPPAHWPAAVAAFLGQATAQGRIAAALGCGAWAPAPTGRPGWPASTWATRPSWTWSGSASRAGPGGSPGRAGTGHGGRGSPPPSAGSPSSTPANAPPCTPWRPAGGERHPNGASRWPWGACSIPEIPAGSWSSAGRPAAACSASSTWCPGATTGPAWT
jgi:lysylphosphatidylglycerol synthetase-like protein (DUF2156 family)